jgi:hypothetical protein
MKKLIFSALILSAFFAQAQDSVFYYDALGGKIYLKRDARIKYVQFV